MEILFKNCNNANDNFIHIAWKLKFIPNTFYFFSINCKNNIYKQIIKKLNIKNFQSN